MISTVVKSLEGKMIVSKTLVETAKEVTGMSGCFHAKDILFALQSQGVNEITEAQIRSQLKYDGGFYTGSKSRAPKSYKVLEYKGGGWFVWHTITRADR